MMNERIRHLTEKVFFDKDTSVASTMVYTFTDVKMEKFAELIIKECAMVASRAENNDRELRCVYDVITEHFGVK